MADNTSDNRRMAKNTVYLYLRMLITLAISLYTSRAFLDALGVEDYGIYDVVGGFVTIFSVLVGSLRSAAQRFITFSLGAGDITEQKKTFATFESLFLIMAVILFLVIEIVGLTSLDSVLNIPQERLDVAYFVFHCSTITFVINLIAVPYNSAVLAHERMNFFALVSIGESFARLGLAFLLYWTDFDHLIVYSVVLCLISICIRLLYSIYCKKHFDETRVKLSIDKDIFKKVFSYSVWVTIGTSSAVFKEQGVNLVINSFFGVAMNAARGISNHISGVVSMFATNIGQAIIPQITKSYASGDVDRSIKLTQFFTKIQGLSLIVICIPLYLEIDNVLSLWLKEVPYYAEVFAKWSLILCLARSIENTVVPLMLATGKVKYPQLIASTTMMMNLPFSYIALKLGAEPVSTMIIGVVIEIAVLWIVSLFLHRYIDFPVLAFFKTSVLPIIIVMFISALLPYYLRCYLPQDSFFSFIIVCGTAFLMTIILSYVIALNKQEKEQVKSYARKFIRK